MQDKADKLRRLALVARRYYLEDKKQSDIAAELGVSRPLISRMLSEARELGVVEITIHAPGETADALLRRLAETTSLHGGALVSDAETTARPISPYAGKHWHCWSDWRPDRWASAGGISSASWCPWWRQNRRSTAA